MKKMLEVIQKELFYYKMCPPWRIDENVETFHWIHIICSLIISDKSIMMYAECAAFNKTEHGAFTFISIYSNRTMSLFLHKIWFSALLIKIMLLLWVKYSIIWHCCSYCTWVYFYLLYTVLYTVYKESQANCWFKHLIIWTVINSQPI